MRPLFDEGAVALVTGGSGAIGGAIVRAFAEHKVAVAIAYYTNEEAAAQLEEELRSDGLNAIRSQVDLKDEQSIRRLCADTKERLGAVSHLINNAAVRRDHPVTRMSEASWDEVINTDLRGAFLLARYVMMPMARLGKGSIVNIGSIAARRTMFWQANYCAAKAGLAGLSRVLAKEGAAYGVRSNLVSPGFINSDSSDQAESVGREVVPIGRVGVPDDVAQAAVFLSSNGASYITGADVVVDGGLIL